MSWWPYLSAFTATKPTPPIVVLPQLRTSGQFFELDTMEPFTAIECSAFNAFGRYQKGGRDAVEPQLKERRDLGYNLLRVFTLYDLAHANIGVLLDPDYDRIPAFVNLCAEYGLYVEFVGYTSWLDPTHWPRLCEAARACPTKPLLEYVNEYDQPANHRDPLGRELIISGGSEWGRIVEPNGRVTVQQRPMDLICSHGSNGSQQQPVTPFANYATFHTNMAPEEPRKVGHNAWEIWDGPTLTNETSRYPDGGGMWREESTSPPMASYDAAAGASLLCAGACFHSVNGKTFVMFGSELPIAAEWPRGCLSVPLTCQPGGYRRRDDLLSPGINRVYQRGTKDECIVYIHGEMPPNPNPGPDPLPPDPSPHQMKVGYFTVVSSLPGCGDHRADVADFTTCNLASSYNENEPKAQNGAHSFGVLAQERKFMLWWPNLGSGSTMIDQACLDSIQAMIPHWGNVDAVLLDEVAGDEADVDRLCDEWTEAVESFGLEPKPLWVGFTVNDLLTRTGYQSNRIDVCVFEAYIHPKYQNELDVLDILDDIIDSQLERLGTRVKAMVCQGYRQERGGIKWTNMQSLFAVNRRTIERAKNIPNLQALLIFTLVRPPSDGSLEIGLVPEHRQLLKP